MKTVPTLLLLTVLTLTGYGAPPEPPTLLEIKLGDPMIAVLAKPEWAQTQNLKMGGKKQTVEQATAAYLKKKNAAADPKVEEKYCESQASMQIHAAFPENTTASWENLPLAQLTVGAMFDTKSKDFVVHSVSITLATKEGETPKDAGIRAHAILAKKYGKAEIRKTSSGLTPPGDPVWEWKPGDKLLTTVSSQMASVSLASFTFTQQLGLNMQNQAQILKLEREHPGYREMMEKRKAMLEKNNIKP